MVQRALEHLDRGGVLAINAIHMSPIPEMEYSTIYHERTVRSVANSTREDAVEFLKEAAAAHIKPQVTNYPLENAVEALFAMKNGSLNGAAVLSI
jgi:propanol-preferring alcohol dehydrogenase